MNILTPPPPHKRLTALAAGALAATALAGPALAECGPGNLPDETVIGFAKGSYMAFEGNDATLTVRKNGPAAPKVYYETSDRPKWQFNQFNAGEVGSPGTATPGTDFTSQTGTLTWSGDSATITVPILTDSEADAWERFYVNLAMDVEQTPADTHSTVEEQCANPPASFSRYRYFASVSIRE
ncbi:MAG: hypothetical protein OXF07_08305 [Rhodobacter sp.]|nr:hypothetical protein [Rhodobacter sp.]